MTKIKLTDNLSLSQIIRGFWRLDTWELSTDELIVRCLDWKEIDRLWQQQVAFQTADLSI